MGPICYPRNDELLKEDIKKMNEEKIPKYVRLYEAYLQKNGGNYFVGNRVKIRVHTFFFFLLCNSWFFLLQLTWADVAIFNSFESLVDPTSPLYVKYSKNRLGDARLNALKDAPGLQALLKKVAAEPGIKKWLDKRKSNEETNFWRKNSTKPDIVLAFQNYKEF